jgi:hypothetical protein
MRSGDLPQFPVFPPFALILHPLPSIVRHRGAAYNPVVFI